MCTCTIYQFLPEGGEGSSLRAGLAGANPRTLTSLMPPGELSAEGVGPFGWLSSSVLQCAVWMLMYKYSP